MNTNYSLIFYLKKMKNYVNGPKPIYMRITVSGVRRELSTGRECDLLVGIPCPIETVSKMLGHKNLKTTQHYAKLLDVRIGRDMQALQKRLATV